MNHNDKIIDKVVRYILAEDHEDREFCKKELKDIIGREISVSADSENIIRDILLDIGAPDHLLGHAYVIEAIKLVLQDRSYIDKIIKRLYPDVACKFSTTAPRVERSIRHLVETCWERCDMEIIGKYFGNTVSASKGKPTNSEFIARIAAVVRQRMK